MTEVYFSREHPLNMIDEAKPLFEKHHAEISLFKDLKLQPDFMSYVHAEEADMLRVFTARTINENSLVGYIVFYLRPSTHFADTLEAVQDLVFINPDDRGFGMKFLKWCDNKLAMEGVNLIYHHVNARHDFSPMLTRNGYELNDLVFVKRLT
jgi:hypothetical protein